jgi:hypothetical protein
MKLTKQSKTLIQFFSKNNCIVPLKQTNKTNKILSTIFYLIKNSFSYINSIEINPSIFKINKTNKIPKPRTFDENVFVSDIISHININSSNCITYNFNLFDRRLTFYFVTENIPKNINIYNNYVKNMLVWLHIITQNKQIKCSSNLSVFIYHTNLLKYIPKSETTILNEMHVNTAFTKTCAVDSEIVIYRKEEWFKVFLHETFHTFALDFSDMNIQSIKNKILNLFPVSSNASIYEAYAEFWARIMNISFCSYHNIKDKNSLSDFLNNTEFFINYERIYSFFQMTKILQFMNMEYDDLYERNKKSSSRRQNYKENTNVLAYYIITTILMNNYQEFIQWCFLNNNYIFYFKKTNKNLQQFYSFIEQKYKTPNLLKNTKCTNYLIQQLNSKYKKKNSFLLDNLRMTICELE